MSYNILYINRYIWIGKYVPAEKSSIISTTVVLTIFNVMLID